MPRPHRAAGQASPPSQRLPMVYGPGALLQRRHLTKGQQAMTLAMIYPDADEKGGRGKKVFRDETVSSGENLTLGTDTKFPLPTLADALGLFRLVGWGPEAM